MELPRGEDPFLREHHPSRFVTLLLIFRMQMWERSNCLFLLIDIWSVIGRQGIIYMGGYKFISQDIKSGWSHEMRHKPSQNTMKTFRLEFLYWAYTLGFLELKQNYLKNIFKFHLEEKVNFFHSWYLPTLSAKSIVGVLWQVYKLLS